MEVASTSEKINDQLLISQIHRKNKKVFESVYKQYYKRLYTLSYQYVSNREMAEETVHDVFIRIWKKPEEIVLTTSLKSYLYRSVINTSLNYIKKEKAAEEKHMEYAKSWNDVLPGAVNADETEQLYLRLETAIGQLPAQCKKVMLLSRFEKLKQQEIADQLGISIKTVKNHLTYGFNKMRSILYT